MKNFTFCFLIYLLTLFICCSCIGGSIRATGSGSGSGAGDTVVVTQGDSQHSEGGDSILMELSAKRFKVPVDTIISTRIVNNTKCSSITLTGKRIVEKKMDGKWVPFEHRQRSKGGALYSTTLLSVNIGSGGSYDINMPLRSKSYEKEFSPGEYRLGREIEINGRGKRYVYSVFTVY